jgi:hypothetical protein
MTTPLFGYDVENIAFLTDVLDGIDAITRTELSNFLMGRTTTVSNEAQFTDGLREITKDAEAANEAGGIELGTATGEVFGALEAGAVVGLAGGVIAIRGLQIIEGLHDLATGSDAEERARQDRADFSFEAATGVIHGAQGTPSRHASDLIDQFARAQAQAGKKAGVVPDERKFGNTDPVISRPIVDDGSGDVANPALDIIDAGQPNLADGALANAADVARADADRAVARDEAAQAAGDVAARVGNVGAVAVAAGVAAAAIEAAKTRFNPNAEDNQSPSNPDSPHPPPAGIVPRPATQGLGIDTAKGVGELRAQFKQTGTQFIRKLMNTPMDVQNDEWAEFNYVGVDQSNGIEISNILNDMIRFSEPLFSPPPPPQNSPISSAVPKIMQMPMTREVQLRQPFMDKFDGALTGPINMTATYNHSVIPSHFTNLTLYNPI